MFAYSLLNAGEHVIGPEGCNYAIATGSRSGVFVVDFDSLEAFEKHQDAWPQTYTVATGRGVHLYFRNPENNPVRNSAGELGPGIDIRGEGGYVVAPGSKHKSGRLYEVMDDRAPVDAPDWLLKWEGLRATVKHRDLGIHAPTPVEGAKLEERTAKARAFLVAAEPSIQGQDGSGKLWDVALHLVRRLELPLDGCAAAIDAHYNPRCNPPWSEQEIWHKLEDARDKSDMPCGIPLEGWDWRKHQVCEVEPPPPAASGHVYTFDPTAAIRPTKYRTDEATGETKRQGLKKLEVNELVFLLTDGDPPAWRFRYNEFDDQMYALNPPCPMTAEHGVARLPDEDLTSIRVWLEVTADARPTYSEDISSAVNVICRRFAFHPIRDWLRALPVTTTSHLDNLAAQLFGDDRPIAQDYLRKQLIASCARLFEPGCQVDTMLVLVGPKGGERKSTAIRELYTVPNCGRTFRSNLPDIRDMQKIGPALDGVWVAELAELAVVRKADVETLKDFMTRREERYSPKWVKGEVTRPRQCVLWGSTNEERFLDRYDSAFRRRFLTIHMKKRTDLEWLAAHRVEIWAEAFALYQASEPWWYEDEDVADAGRSEFVAEDPWLDALRAYTQGIKAKKWVTSKDLYTSVTDDKGIPSDVEYKKISRIMSELRHTKSKKEGVPGWWLGAENAQVLPLAEIRARLEPEK